MISYAQNHEDVLLARCFAGQDTGFFVDVGAWDPVLHSVTNHFSQQGWRGINIEPAPAYFEKLLEARPNEVNLQCVVSNTEGTTDFTVVFGSGLSTAEHLEDSFLEDLEGGGYRHSSAQMPVRTLAAICAEHVPEGTVIDFLKIDVEGFEGRVIEGADWEAYRPRVVVVEAMQPLSFDPVRKGPNVSDTSEVWDPVLRGHGYVFAAFDGLNRFYVRREEPDLAAAFVAPANVLDDYVGYDEWLAKQNVEEMRTELATAAAEAEKIQAELRGSNAELEAKVSGLQTERDILSEALGSARGELEDMRSSRSWKLTAPLRSLTTLVRRKP